MLTLIACSGPPSPVGGLGQEPAPSAYHDGQPASSPAFEYLPAGTQLVIAARSVASLAEALGWRELGGRHRASHARAVAEITQLFGHNLLDPEVLSEVGLDPDKAFGFAWLGDDTGVFFAPLIDHDRFQTSVYRTASRLETTLIPRVLGPSLIIGPKRSKKWQLVIRGQTALLVIADGSAVAIAQRVAEIDADRSLAGQPDFASAMADLRFGKDLAGYARAGVLLGDGAEMLGVGRDVPVAFGAEIRDEALRFKAFLAVEDGSIFRGALENRAAPSPLALATVARPLLLLSANVNGAAAARVPLVQELLGPLGALGVDLGRDLAPLVAGEVGVALVEARPMTETTLDPTESMGVNAVLEVSDPARVRELLARALGQGRLAGKARAGADAGSYVVGDLGWKHLHVGVSGRYLHVSSDPGFGGRVSGRSGPRGGRGQGPADAAVRELVSRPGGALHAQVDAALVNVWLMGPSSPTATMVPVRQAEGDDLDADAPFSDEYRRKQRKLEAAEEELGRAARALDEHHAQRALAVARAFGVTALRAEEVAGGVGGVVVYGGQFFGERGMATALDAVVELATDRGSASSAQEMAWSDASNRVWQLRDEVARLRARDVERHRANGPPAPPDPDASGGGGAGAGATGGAPRGDLDKEAIRRHIRRAVPRVRYCYEKELARDPSLGRVKVVVDFVVAPSGRVATATVTGGIDPMRRCIEAAVKAIRFPKPAGAGNVRVSYPFVFTANAR